MLVSAYLFAMFTWVSVDTPSVCKPLEGEGGGEMAHYVGKTL